MQATNVKPWKLTCPRIWGGAVEEERCIWPRNLPGRMPYKWMDGYTYPYICVYILERNHVSLKIWQTFIRRWRLYPIGYALMDAIKKTEINFTTQKTDVDFIWNFPQQQNAEKQKSRKLKAEKAESWRQKSTLPTKTTRKQTLFCFPWLLSLSLSLSLSICN